MLTKFQFITVLYFISGCPTDCTGLFGDVTASFLKAMYTAYLFGDRTSNIFHNDKNKTLLPLA